MTFLTRHILILFLLSSICGFAQIRIITSKADTINASKINQALTTIITSKPDTVSHWTNKNILGIDLSEIAFVNWSAGGTSAITGLVRGNIKRDYKDEKQVWSSELVFRYGMNKQEGIQLRKTDDVFRLNSTYGLRTSPTS